MHNLKTLLFAFCVLALIANTSCKKERIETYGNATALVNGTYWQGEIRVETRYNKFDMLVEKYKRIDGVYVPWEIFGFLYFEKSTERQKLINHDSIVAFTPWDAIHAYGSFSTSQSDGDVACDFYKVIETDSTNNWVRIDKEKGNYTEVWGSFGMHLYRTRTCSSSIYPDTLMITNGEFHFEL